jgi:hypothetical protein
MDPRTRQRGLGDAMIDRGRDKPVVAVIHSNLLNRKPS